MRIKQFYNKNQFIIYEENKTIFKSYNSTIAILENGVLTLGRKWDYSKTTAKHLYLFINDYCYFRDFEINSSTKKKWVEKNLKNGNIKYNINLE